MKKARRANDYNTACQAEHVSVKVVDRIYAADRDVAFASAWPWPLAFPTQHLAALEWVQWGCARKLEADRQIVVW